MPDSITPIPKKTLADNLAQELRNFIVKQRFIAGDKLPSTTELAQRFGVGMPTLREGLKKLETIGAVNIRHGSGIYVGEHINSLFLMNPIVSAETPNRKQLLDLIEARLAIEPNTAALAAKNATAEQIATMHQLLDEAKKNFGNENVLNQKNMMFHKAISRASGNAVFVQMLSVLTSLFRNEQRLLIDIFRSVETDHEQHLEILHAIENRNDALAKRLMFAHLDGVRSAILRWEPES